MDINKFLRDLFAKINFLIFDITYNLFNSFRKG